MQAAINYKRFPENNMKRFLSLLICAVIIIASAFPAAASTYPMGPAQKGVPDNVRMAGVTLPMMQASYWDTYPGSDVTLMTLAEIRAENDANIHNSACCMNDLSALPETFDGIKMRANLVNFENPGKLYLNGELLPASFYDRYRANIAGARAAEVMNTGYGFCTNRSSLKSIPNPEWLADDPTDPEWDNTVLAPVLVNEPLAAYLSTADGAFTYVKTECCEGWMPTADLVLCHSKAEWEEARDPEQFLVVTGPEVITEESYVGAHSQRILEMGVKLALSDEPVQTVDNRWDWCNYVVYFPGRGADGLFEKQKMLIPFGADVSVGYLRYTQKNVIDLAFKCVGKRYGWGGSMNAQDCSSFAREIYLCFGFILPRNTTWQGKMKATVIDLTGMDAKNKEAALDRAAPGSILQFPGHEMIYIGHKDGRHYTVNDVSSLAEDTADGLKKRRVRSVVVNSLEDTKRPNGKTWYNELTTIITLP